MSKKEFGKLDFRKLFQSLRGFFVIIDKNFEIVASTDAYLEFANLEHPEIIGKTLAALFPKNHEVISALQDVVKTGESRDLIIDTATGNLTGMEFTPVPGENENVDFIIVKFVFIVREKDNVDAGKSIQDLESNQYHEQLNKTKELFANVFEFNPAALAISRISDSKIINVNESFLRLFDFSAKSEVLGKTSEQLKLLVEPEQRNEILRLLTTQGKIVNMEGNIRTVKGNIKWTSASFITVNVDDQSCLMAVMLDITDRKIAEDKIKSINADLEHQVIERTKERVQTELEYQSVIEQASDAIFISDSVGKYIDANPSACNMLGYSKSELLRMTVKDVLLPEELLRNPPKWSELQNGKTILSSRNLIRKDGSIVPVEINAKMLSNGKMLGMVRDITERQKNEEEIRKMNAQLEEKVMKRTAELEQKINQLKESEEKFQKAFHASSAGITITRLSDSLYVDVNPAFLQMIGYSREEVINHSSVDLGLVVDLKRRDEVLKQIRDTGSMKHMEMTVRKKSGEHLEILASIETILHHGEKYAINIIYDITERKRAEEKLEAVNKELEAFSYSVSHDLRAPLRSVMGYAGIIQEDLGDKINEDIKRQLDKIKQNASKMGHLIDDLLEFSRIGRQELTKSTINTDSIVEKNLHDLKATTQTRAQFIVHDLLPSYADLSMLNQAWLNLISNAIKYSSKKKQPIIEIGSYNTDGEAVFYIKDNGAGFNMEFGSKLFGVFQRLHGPSEFEGTGVGLALVKRIIDKHGGRVWAEGKENEGAVFYFSLPQS